METKLYNKLLKIFSDCYEDFDRKTLHDVANDIIAYMVPAGIGTQTDELPNPVPPVPVPKEPVHRKIKKAKKSRYSTFIHNITEMRKNNETSKYYKVKVHDNFKNDESKSAIIFHENFSHMIGNVYTLDVIFEQVETEQLSVVNFCAVIWGMLSDKKRDEIIKST